MQIQSTGQSQSLAQMQQTQTQPQNQIRKMDGSGNGQGLQNGSNSTVTQATTAQNSVPLATNSTFSTFA